MKYISLAMIDNVEYYMRLQKVQVKMSYIEIKQEASQRNTHAYVYIRMYVHTNDRYEAKLANVYAVHCCVYSQRFCNQCFYQKQIHKIICLRIILTT